MDTDIGTQKESDGNTVTGPVCAHESEYGHEDMTAWTVFCRRGHTRARALVALRDARAGSELGVFIFRGRRGSQLGFPAP